MPDLEQLLRDAKAAQAAKPLRRRDPIKHHTYDPPKWTATRKLALIHEDSEGNRTPLGLYQEFTMPLGNARRLMAIKPATSGPPPSVAIEIVRGDYWLNSPPARKGDSDMEIVALRKRFKELMGRFV